MAEPRKAGAPPRLVVTVAVVAATLGGAIAIAADDAPAEVPSALEAPSLAPLPALEPLSAEPRRPFRRPIPLATTRSSR